jgi:hypothetical protein
MQPYFEYTKSNYCKDPHYSSELQAHWARAKRQQHLPKELVPASKI